jgi:TnpA family transposase
VEKSFPHTGPLLTRRLNTDLITEHWDDLLRLAGSLKFRHYFVPAGRQALGVGPAECAGAALKEYGALRRSVYTTCYLADPVYRRTLSR